MAKFIFIYVTVPNGNEAKRIADFLLEKRLVACVNMFPIKSMYWWRRKIGVGEEIVLILKTVEKNYNKIKLEIGKMHSYSVPCITKIPVIPNVEYGQWILKEVK